MNKLLSIEDAAELLGLSPWTLRMYLRKKMLCHVKIGRRVLIETEELERFVSSWKAARTNRVSTHERVCDADGDSVIA
jgi:excisionase family DNA binding protein